MIYSGEKLSRTQDVFLLQRQFQRCLDSSHVVSLLEKTILDFHSTKRLYNSIIVSTNSIIIIIVMMMMMMIIIMMMIMMMMMMMIIIM